MHGKSVYYSALHSHWLDENLSCRAEALPSLQGIKDDEFADPAFSISYVDEVRHGPVMIIDCCGVFYDTRAVAFLCIVYAVTNLLLPWLKTAIIMHDHL